MGCKQKWVVILSETEKMTLESMQKKGRHNIREVTRAKVLLLADQCKKNREIVEETGLREQAIISIKKRYVENGLVLKDKPRSGQPKRLDKRGESYLMALACSPAPEGRDIWTMQLLADKLVEMKVVERISDEAVRKYLKKMNLSLGSKSNGA